MSARQATSGCAAMSVVPPGGARLLGADADEIRRTRPPRPPRVRAPRSRTRPPRGHSGRRRAGRRGGRAEGGRRGPAGRPSAGVRPRRRSRSRRWASSRPQRTVDVVRQRCARPVDASADRQPLALRAPGRAECAPSWVPRSECPRQPEGPGPRSGTSSPRRSAGRSRCSPDALVDDGGCSGGPSAGQPIPGPEGHCRRPRAGPSLGRCRRGPPPRQADLLVFASDPTESELRRERFSLEVVAGTWDGLVRRATPGGDALMCGIAGILDAEARRLVPTSWSAWPVPWWRP